MNTWLAVCHDCHTWITEHSKEAIELGLSDPRNTPIMQEENKEEHYKKVHEAIDHINAGGAGEASLLEDGRGVRTKDVPAIDMLVAIMLNGDPNCSIPLESNVEKTSRHFGDANQIGDKGVVKGSIMMEKQEWYLVEFSNMDAPVVTVGESLTKID